MQIASRIGCVALITHLAATVSAATITLKDGQVVEGTIEGLVVLKGALAKEPDTNKPGVVRHSVTYWLIDGREIVRIDQKGIERETDRTIAFGLATRDDAEPAMIAALDKIYDERNAAFPTLQPSRDPATFVAAMGSGRSREGKTRSIPIDSIVEVARR